MYKVLIVDDDLATLYMLKRFKNWAEYGFSIEGEACDGKEALYKLLQMNFDLIITDIKMPGMDGIEFIQELRSKNIDTCVIFLSTHSDFQFAKQGIRYGVFEYMTKPLEEETLIDILVRARAYIHSKIRQSEKQNETESATEEDSSVYYPRNHESRLVSYILGADSRLKAEAIEAFREICLLCDREAAKVRVLSNTLIYNVKNKIDETFPWLGKIEGGTAYVRLGDSTEIRQMEQEFIQKVSGMQENIQKYQLNHPDSIIRRICQCVIDNIENEISLELIANEVHISRDYVGKIFKQKVLCNFNDYVTRVKMEHAKYLIISGDYKNYEISEKLGYKKADYFSSLFKSYTGVTPMEYRKNRLDVYDAERLE
ncbi:MAG: two component transcriptional regulator, AraC family [Eubacterium sp.]|jgi:two-component system response regulator YesN|nr:two component transcriptional regulator, AraC family [Eubacterium sp.]